MANRTQLTIAVIAAAIAAGAAAPAHAQRGARAFTAAGESCSDITWSQDALRQYPNIASACRDVMERDGRYYVKFEGEVTRVRNRGQEVTIDFRDGDELTLTPPENMSLTVNGRPTNVRDLRPGDDLTFFVPQDQLAASFFEGEPETAPPRVVLIAPTEPAAADSSLVAQNQTRSTLPRTASPLPLAAAAGSSLILLGAVLTLHRRRRQSSKF